MTFADLCTTLSALIRDVPHPLSNLANASALFWQELEGLNWVGFYLLPPGEEGAPLVLGPFQGKPACMEIPLGRGVCGTAALADKSTLVADVHQFPGHIACDAASASELVIPLHKRGCVVGVLDLDSPEKGRFTEEDRLGLEACVRILEDALPEDFPAKLL